jgi:MFS family permease
VQNADVLSYAIAASPRHRRQQAAHKLTLPTGASAPQVLYAAALVPVGLLADKADRPRLLAAGIAAWSVLTMAASQVHNCRVYVGCRPCRHVQ